MDNEKEKLANDRSFENPAQGSNFPLGTTSTLTISYYKNSLNLTEGMIRAVFMGEQMVIQTLVE